MKIYRLNLSLRESMDKEYIVTNGLGSYASSSINSMNTRRYHGLMVSKYPGSNSKNVLLSKIDESIVIGEDEEILYTNISNGYISDGFKRLESVEHEYFPKITYDVCGIKISKEVVMKHLEDTTVIRYTVNTSDYKKEKVECDNSDNADNIVLRLTPIITNRNFHTLKDAHSDNILEKQEVLEGTNSNSSSVLYNYTDGKQMIISSSDGDYIIHDNDYYNGMYYIREDERGFDNTENLIVPGHFEVIVPRGVIKEIYIVCTLEGKDALKDITPQKVFKDEEKRLKDIISNANFSYKYEDEIMLSKSKSKITKLEDFKKNLVIAADQFVIKKDDYVSVIAGYPWFLDWQRDTLISFEGLFLKTNRFEDAKKVLQYAICDMKEGIIPNGYGEDGMPYYNAADASLLLFEAVAKYLEYTDDYDFVISEMYDSLKDIIKNYKEGTNFADNNIYLDDDYLIHSGSPKIQNTWMDAVVSGYPVTPRNGKAVDINGMWYNALKVLQDLAKYNGEHELEVNLNELANNCKKSFNEKFVSKKGGLKDTTEDDKIRPNQLFAISLTHKVVDNCDIAESIITVCNDKLLNRYGLKTLAKGEEHYTDKYFGDSTRRDFSYHNGITWPWLNIPYYYGLKYVMEITGKQKYEKELEKYIKKMYDTYSKWIYQRPCINGISEICDSTFPYDPNGTITQAWSVAAAITVLF